MKLEITLDKWGFGFYSDFFAVDFTYGFLFSVIGILLIRKVLKRNNLFWYGNK